MEALRCCSPFPCNYLRQRVDNPLVWKGSFFTLMFTRQHFVLFYGTRDKLENCADPTQGPTLYTQRMFCNERYARSLRMGLDTIVGGIPCMMALVVHVKYVKVRPCREAGSE